MSPAMLKMTQLSFYCLIFLLADVKDQNNQTNKLVRKKNLPIYITNFNTFNKILIPYKFLIPLRE